MVETLILNLERFPNRELYFHNVFGDGGVVVQALKDGKPLFCLRGRATLKNGESVLGGSNGLVFHIPEVEKNEVIKLIYPSPFETDTAENFPTYFTLVQPVLPEHIGDAQRWILQQQIIPARSEFLGATVTDVRALPAKYFLGVA